MINHAIELEQHEHRRWREQHDHKKCHVLWLELHALQQLVQLQRGLQEQLLHELNFFYEFYTHKRLVYILIVFILILITQFYQFVILNKCEQIYCDNDYEFSGLKYKVYDDIGIVHGLQGGEQIYCAFWKLNDIVLVRVRVLLNRILLYLNKFLCILKDLTFHVLF